MEIYKSYLIETNTYDLYQAASGDWCVCVNGTDCFNIGEYSKALEFILDKYILD